MESNQSAATSTCATFNPNAFVFIPRQGRGKEPSAAGSGTDAIREQQQPTMAADASPDAQQPMVQDATQEAQIQDAVVALVSETAVAAIRALCEPRCECRLGLGLRTLIDGSILDNPDLKRQP